MSAGVDRLLAAVYGVDPDEPSDLDYAEVQVFEERLASLARWDRMRAFGSRSNLDGPWR